MLKFEDVTVRIEGPVGFATLDRADKGNRLSPQTLAELCSAVDQLTADASVRAIVLNASGKHFCAGADFAFLETLACMSAPDIKAQIYSHFQGAAKRLYHCPKPTLALVQGAAVTVGCELALACDFRIVADNAVFHESWIKLGLMPPLGGLFLLPRLIGMGRAAQMVLRGEQVKADEAVRIGLASETIAQGQLQARGLEFALELAASAPLAYAAVKEALHRGLETGMEAEWSSNVVSQAILLGTQDFREGLNAAKGKRAADFRGN